MININILSLLILILSIYANAIIDTYDEDEDEDSIKLSSIGSITPEMCKNLKQLVASKLKDIRQKEKSLRDYFTNLDDELDYMLLQGVGENHKKKCGCYILHLLLKFYSKTIRNTIQSEKHKNVNLELTNIAVSMLALEDLLEKCGITCNPKKDPLLKRIEDYMKQHGDDGVNKAIAELEFLFQMIEKQVYI
ncbi:IL-10-like protein [Mudlarkpox virus]|nr:IL-10-like protein [Mudlarkpox virus]